VHRRGGTFPGFRYPPTQRSQEQRAQDLKGAYRLSWHDIGAAGKDAIGVRTFHQERIMNSLNHLISTWVMPRQKIVKNPAISRLSSANNRSHMRADKREYL
jgi:hypothetical protein